MSAVDDWLPVALVLPTAPCRTVPQCTLICYCSTPSELPTCGIGLASYTASTASRRRSVNSPRSLQGREQCAAAAVCLRSVQACACWCAPHLRVRPPPDEGDCCSVGAKVGGEVQVQAVHAVELGRAAGGWAGGSVCGWVATVGGRNGSEAAFTLCHSFVEDPAAAHSSAADPHPALTAWGTRSGRRSSPAGPTPAPPAGRPPC